MDKLSLSDIKKAFTDIGLNEGMFLEVHSSLSSFGKVNGGADTIIAALMDVLGNEGAIIMPSFPMSKPLELTDKDRERGLTCKIKILDPDSDERTGMGVIADTFRKRPDVKTGEGMHRMSAWGADIEHNSQGLTHLHNKDGHCLLMGVDIYRFTSMHYVESNLPAAITNIFKPDPEIRKYYPENEWFIETGSPPVKAWYTIQDLAFQKGHITEMYIGKSRCMFFKVNDVINIYREKLETDALGLYGLRQQF